MEVAKRNRLIKKVLEQRFGRGKVRVRGSTGTAYGWINVKIYTPNDGRRWSERNAEVMQLLNANKIEIGTYGYDDPGSDYGYGSKISINFEEPKAKAA